MRKDIAAAGVVLIVLAVLGAILLSRQGEEPEQGPEPGPLVKPRPGGEPVSPQPVEPPAPKPIPMEFTRDGVAGEISGAVERVVRPGRAKVAVCPRNGGRWVCILVDARKRYYELDRGLTLDDFPALKDAGFAPPPAPVSRTSTSIYRSVAKRAMDYKHESGDRIIVLLCPRDDWPQLPLTWPAPRPRPE